MIVLSSRDRDALISRVTEHPHREVCGVLGGEYGRDRSIVTSVSPTDNVAADPEWEYEIDPEELLDRIEAIEASGEDVVGFYHSHPSGPAGPSVTDDERATWTDYSYLIVDLSGEPTIGSWRWRGGSQGFEREQVVIAESD